MRELVGENNLRSYFSISLIRTLGALGLADTAHHLRRTMRPCHAPVILCSALGVTASALQNKLKAESPGLTFTLMAMGGKSVIRIP